MTKRNITSNKIIYAYAVTWEECGFESLGSPWLQGGIGAI